VNKKLVRLARNAVDLVQRPVGLAFAGQRASISFPRIVRGGAHISIGTDSHIGPHGWVECFVKYGDQNFKPEIVIGDDVQIGRYLTLTAISSIRIGRGCLFSEHVYISDHAHDVFGMEETPLVSRRLLAKGPVAIGDFCFLGFRSMVMPGVTLGNRCVVGAGSVVTKSFPDNSVIAGTPARVIRSLSND
jgi:acetyltransferase-like isoleucine patch superfamily enzyme